MRADTPARSKIIILIYPVYRIVDNNKRIKTADTRFMLSGLLWHLAFL